MKLHYLIKSSCVAGIFLTGLPMSISASENEVLIKEQPHQVYHVFKDKTLSQATNQIANRSGIRFKINAANQADIINKKLAADDWGIALSQLLQDYNYTTIFENGNIKTVIITGQNGSGQSSDNLVNIESNLANNFPEKYKSFNVGSVMSFDLPITTMKATPVGEKLTLDLPIGQYNINHDNFVDHGDGSSTWIGYLDDEGKGYRVYLSQGEAGLMGNIYSPDGVYNIETVDGKTYLVDLEHSGLKGAGIEHDQMLIPDTPPNIPYLPTSSVDTAPATAAASISSGNTATSSTSTSTAKTTGPVVDLMVLYTTGKQTAKYAKQRIRTFVDMSNQAYADSKINMRLRLVHTRPTTYSETTNNNQALTDLFNISNKAGPFKNIESIRSQYGADLVMLFRPFYARSSVSCGVTFVGFGRGKSGNPRFGYGTVSDGYSKDSLKNYYCGSNTFTHEIGHSLGTVHDRENSNSSGKFPYSYAWGIAGKFGTIMSYKSPTLMLFSTPKLSTQCKGQACGYPEGSSRSSDQSKTINYTAPYVANYRAKKVIVPVIK